MLSAAAALWAAVTFRTLVALSATMAGLWHMCGLGGADNSRDNDWAVCPADHAAAISIHRQCVTMLVNAARYIGEEVEFVHD